MDACPRCGEQETVAHVLECKDEEAIQVFNDSVECLGGWMAEVGIEEEVI